MEIELDLVELSKYIGRITLHHVPREGEFIEVTWWLRPDKVGVGVNPPRLFEVGQVVHKTLRAVPIVFVRIPSPWVKGMLDAAELPEGR